MIMITAGVIGDYRGETGWLAFIYTRLYSMKREIAFTFLMFIAHLHVEPLGQYVP